MADLTRHDMSVTCAARSRDYRPLSFDNVLLASLNSNGVRSEVFNFLTPPVIAVVRSLRTETALVARGEVV